MLKTFFTNMYEHANEMNRMNLIALTRQAARQNGLKKLLDLGCDDGVWTRRLADAVGAGEIHGVEVVAEQAKKAEANGVRVYAIDSIGRSPGFDRTASISSTRIR